MSNLPAKQVTFGQFLNSTGTQSLIRGTLGDQKLAQRFAANILSAVSVNPELQKCDPKTILSGAFLGNALNLSPSPQLGQFYLVPFNDKKSDSKMAVFVLGYKGYIQLALRSGYYRKLNAIAVKQGELKTWNPFTEEIVVEPIMDDEKRESAPTIGYYAMFEYTNGFQKAMYWSKDKMIAHADRYSPAFKKAAYKLLLEGMIPQNEMWKYSSFWYKEFDEMALKTMLRQLISKWGIMSIDMQSAMEADERVINENGVPQDEIIIEPYEPELPAEQDVPSFVADSDKTKKSSKRTSIDDV